MAAGGVTEPASRFIVPQPPFLPVPMSAQPLSRVSAVPAHPLRQSLTEAIAQVNRLVVGKPQEIDLAFTCLLAEGHLLLDDLPGTGKTTLARALAVTLGLTFHRVQFTSDLMPSDIVGVSVYDQKQQQFEFHHGPIFTEVLLADEINRASPRTQSALLEAMAEHQVTVDRTTHHLADPFFVIATQNPIDLVGTFPLPDAQMDRFLFRLSLGYPSQAAEFSLMRQADRQEMLADASPCLSAAQVRGLRDMAQHLTASDSLLHYIQRLVEATRTHSSIRSGLSTRGTLALLKAARAHALIQDRETVLPEDVQAVFVPVAAHRLTLELSQADVTATSLAKDIQHGTPVL